MASIERTAYPRFKRTVTARELHELFTPSVGEIEWVKGLTRSAEHLLALVVLLKSLARYPVQAEDRAVPRPTPPLTTPKISRPRRVGPAGCPADPPSE